MSSPPEILSLALRHHQAGQLPQAEQLYRQILQGDPRHADALHLLGVLISQAGRDDLAIEYIQQALKVKPHTAVFHNNLGFSLQALGRLDEAAFHYQQAVRLKPDFAGAHNNLGNVQRSMDKREEAVRSYRQALHYQPDYAEAHNNLGVALQEQGRLDEAVICHRQALRLKPEFIDAFNNLGVALQSQKKLDEALTLFEQALRLKPDDAETNSNLGNVLKEQGKLESAVAHYRKAVGLKPTYAVGHNNLGFALQEQGNFEEAMASYGQALGLQHDLAVAHWNRSLLRLMVGDFAEGWAEYEWRWTQPSFTRRSFPQPLWEGSDLCGRTILLHVEQGFGDVFQFIRYVKLLDERGGKAIVECHPQLVQILAGVNGIARLVPLGSALPPFDAYAPLVSLPRIFHTTLTTVPAAVPYLHHDARLVRHWRRELKKSEVRCPVSDVKSPSSDIGHRTQDTGHGFRIGIAWQGNTTYRADRQRSIPLAQFAPLGAVPGVKLISLQKGSGTEQLFDNRQLTADNYSSLDQAAGPFMDTAAIMQHLDLVVCSDSAVVHLAGAMGVPVWLPLPLVPDWRWLLEREDCPWYPTMRLFRQKQYGCWEDVFKAIAEELEKVIERALPNPSAGT
jgi:tetratricopeptide (TPR) repeat protein